MKYTNFSANKQENSNSWILFAIVTAVFFCCANDLYFISQASSPLIYSDAWNFLDTVIKKWMLDGFYFSDLYSKRGMTDHAQPLNKIILLLNYKFFNLDFRFDALVGFFGLVATILLFASIYFQRLARGYSNWFSAVAFVSAILILTSINATELYTWPLVTFGFLTLFLILIIALMAWRFLAVESTFGVIAISSLLIPLIGDTMSIILLVSLTATVIVFSLNGYENYKNRAIKWGVVTSIYVLILFGLINWKFFIGGSNHFLTTQVQNPISWFDPFFYMEIIKIVFSSSLLHRLHFTSPGNLEPVISSIIALVVFGFYVRYFVVLFFAKKCHTMEKFLTTFILFYATVSVIAIVYGRVPVFGIDCLYQPRYVATYQLIPFALMMDFAYSLTYKKINFGVVWTSVFSTVAILFFLMQVMFSFEAHRSVSWISRYYSNQAKAIGNYLFDPSLSPGNCTGATLTLCGMQVDKRNELLNLLKKERLNILNPEFQWKYRIFPFDGKSSELKVLNWMPTKISITNNPIYISIKLGRELLDARSQPVVIINNQKIYPIVNGDVAVFKVPSEITATAGKYSIDLVDEFFSRQVAVGIFEVNTK